MQPPETPADEAERIAALASCGILDTEPEAGFDDIAQLAAAVCNTPIALVSLVDKTRQWFKARVGLRARETPRDFSFCGHAIQHVTPLVVSDALEDPRFADNPLVTGDPYVRFYAGVPLVLEEDGRALGTLCVIDHVPRELTREQLDSLAMLAKRVSRELSLRRRITSMRENQGIPSIADTMRMSDTASRLERQLSPLPVTIGSVVADRYRVDRVLGVGGMGVVTAACDLTSNDTVAIKFMQPKALSDARALQRFVREAQVLHALKNEHVARLLDLGNVASGVPFIVMEYLEGTDLAARLQAEGPLPASEVVTLMLQACSAIGAAHDANIMHRDLKPANLFLTHRLSGEPLLKVLDFGISKLTSGNAVEAPTALTGVAASLGSPHYMAPEQMLGAGTVDGRADIWSLGVVMYELLTGKAPFDGPNVVEICAKVLSLAPISLGDARPDTPTNLVRVVERCLEKDPARRFANVEELTAALRAP